LFNLSHPKTQHDVWAADPMLHTEKGADQPFSGQDWDNVPKVAYETALFRKLAPPRMARVVTNPGSFVLETYGAPPPKPVLTQKVQRSSKEGSALVSHESIGIDLTSRAHSLSEKSSTDLKGLHASHGDSSQELQSKEASHEAGPEGTLKSEASGGLGHESVSASETERELETASQDPDPSAPASNGSAKSPVESLEEEGIQSSESSLEDTDQSSQSFDEGYQLGLLKGIEKAHAEALEEFAFERGELQTQVSTLKAQVESAQAQEITLVAKIDELTQSIEQQRAQLDTEREALRAENAAALESQKKLLEEVTSKLDDFVSNPQRLFEPLTRLSVHIAEQLVLAELNLSGASIERLIHRCLDEISSHSNQVVTVELNTQDKARLQEMTGEMFSHIQLHAVSSLQPGSVRVITDDTQVDDLIGHRLEAMANNLLAQPELWREASPFFKQPLAQRDTDIEDVRQRLTTKVERQEEDQDD